MKKSFLMINAIMLMLILIFDVWYMFGGGLFAKSIASILFVGTGGINLNYCIKNEVSLRFPMSLFIALIFAMLGDILLVINFYLGTAIFAVGHIFYFVAYCILKKINTKDLICGGIISVFSLSVILFTSFLDFGNGLMKGICCVYAIIISFMVGKAISNLLRDRNITNLAIVIGSILFFISDFMLMLNKFGNIPGTNYMCLATYYIGQFVLALSIFVFACTNYYKESIKSIIFRSLLS